MSRTHRRPVGALLVVALALLGSVLAACSDDDSPSAASSPTSSTDAVVAESAHPCAWVVRADKETLNVAYPDTAATYWGLSFSLAREERLELRGMFPDARYASFISYRPTGGAVDVLADRDIAPDEGSSNPFDGESATSTSHRYTLTVRPDQGDETTGNELGARTAESSTGPTTTLPLSAEIQTRMRQDLLGSGGDGAMSGTILYRVYVPSDPDDPSGGAGLPDVTLLEADGGRREIPTCANPGKGAAAGALVEQFGPATDRPAPPQPIFIRPQSDAARLYPNPDNVYVATITTYEPGRIAVVRGKAPTFPDTEDGDTIGNGEQVRYWSMCTNEYRKPYPVTECATDAETALADDGTFTYVISTPEDRPANATEDNGVTWLDWGSTEVNGLLLMRHMMASPSFPESAINLKPGALAQTTMGAYTPVGLYCTKAEFEQDSAACRPG